MSEIHWWTHSAIRAWMHPSETLIKGKEGILALETAWMVHCRIYIPNLGNNDYAWSKASITYNLSRLSWEDPTMFEVDLYTLSCESVYIVINWWMNESLRLRLTEDWLPLWQSNAFWLNWMGRTSEDPRSMSSLNSILKFIKMPPKLGRNACRIFGYFALSFPHSFNWSWSIV